MSRLSLVAAGCLALGLAAAHAQQPKDGIKKERLVGTWEVIKGAPPGSTVEFTKDGKLKLTIKAKDQTAAFEGTYRVEGDKLLITQKVDGKEVKGTDTIKTLTDTELILVTEKGTVEEFRKKK